MNQTAPRSMTQLQIIESKFNAPAMLEKLTKIAPKNFDVEKFQQVAVTALRNNANLAKCTLDSFIAAAETAARFGLSVDGFLGEGSILPYNKKVGDNWISEAKFIPGYQGLVKLAKQSGEIANIRAHVAYEQDQFEYALGDDEHLIHKPKLGGNRGPLKYAYAIAEFRDGHVQREIMAREDIEPIKAVVVGRLRQGATSPWQTHEAEMWRKTVLRRLTKHLPKSTELEKVMSYENQFDNEIGLNIVEGVAEKVATERKPRQSRAKAAMLSGTATPPPERNQDNNPVADEPPPAKKRTPPPQTQQTFQRGDNMPPEDDIPFGQIEEYEG